MIQQRNCDGKTELFDPIRKKWVRCTEEEKVRQSFIQYLLACRNVTASHLSVEKEFAVNGLSKRYDIVIYDREAKPFIVIECKAPSVKLTQDVIEQVGRYNITLQAPVIGVTNGNDNYFFNIDFETKKIHFLEDLPL